MEGSYLKRYSSQITFPELGSNEETEENPYYFERPMMLNVWTQTDDIFIVNNNNSNNKINNATEEELLQKIATLEKELKMYRNFFERMVPQQEQSDIASIATTTVTSNEPRAKRMKTSSIEQQYMQQHAEHNYSYRANIKPISTNSSSSSGSTSIQPSVINDAVPTFTNSVKYIIVGDAGVNGNEEPFEIQLVDDGSTLDLESSAEFGRLEDYLSAEEADIKTKQQQQVQKHSKKMQEREEQDRVHTDKTKDQHYTFKRGNVLFPITITKTTTNTSTGRVVPQTEIEGCTVNADVPVLDNQLNMLEQQPQQQQPFIQQKQEQEQQQQVQQQQHPQNVCHIVTNDRIDHMQLTSLSVIAEAAAAASPAPTSTPTPSTTPSTTPSAPPDNNQQQSPPLRSFRLKQTNKCKPSTTQVDTTTQNMFVSLGPNDTSIPAKTYKSIPWDSASMATRKLMMAVFDRETLATHSMTGKPSPAFKHVKKPTKKQLNPDIVADIVYAVSRKCNVSKKEVRNAITTKCADANKMMRLKVEKKRGSQKADNNKKNEESK